MSDTALAAAYRATFNRLKGPSEWWENRVYPDMGPTQAAYPYVIFFYSGGGARNAVRKNDANLMLTVQCISDDMATALAGAARVEELLDDHGQFDNSTDYLYGGASWHILTITQEEILHLVEQFAQAVPIYHEGARYRFIMEAV